MGKTIIGNIFSETDYSKFKKLKYNRIVNNSRLDKLVASLSKKVVLCPIVVNKNMEIIDGQGRYEAMKKLNLPIIYVIDEDASIDECMLMNRYNTSWTGTDFINSYAEAGVSAYVNLKKVMILVKKPIKSILSITGHAGGAGGSSSLISTGKLVFNESDIELAVKRFEKASEIIESLQFTKRVNEAFYSACRVIFSHPAYDHIRMVNNCKKSKHNYDQMANLDSELKELSSIYNSGIKPNKRIYFEDYMRGRGYEARSYNHEIDDKDISTLRKEEK